MRWSRDGSPNFSLSSAERDQPGTDVILHLMEEELNIWSLHDPHPDQHLLRLHGSAGAVGRKRSTRWIPLAQERPGIDRQDYIDLYNYLYLPGDPLLWVHLNTDYPHNLQGILFFPSRPVGGLGERRDQALLQPGVRQ